MYCPGRPARKTCAAPAVASESGGVLGLLLVQRVAGAQAGLGGAAVLEGALGDGLDAARLEQVGGERRARGVGGGGAERGQEDPRPGPGRREVGVRAGAQRLVRLVAPHPGQSAGRARGLRLALHRALVQVRELADPGDRFAALGQLRAALAPGGRQVLAELGPSAVPPPGRRALRGGGRTPSPRGRVHRSAAPRTRSRPPGRSPGTDATPRPGSSRCCGRCAGRRRPGRPSAWSKGSTVTASAPPTPAARVASVVRSMFTHGSRRVIITGEVTACCRCAPAPGAPQTSATRAHSRRAARSLAMVRNWSARRRVPELQLRAGLFGRSVRPRSAPADRRRRSAREAAQLLRGRTAGLVVRQRVHGQRPQPRVLARRTAGRATATGAKSNVLARTSLVRPAGRRPGCRAPPPWRRPRSSYSRSNSLAAGSTSRPASSTTGARSR